MVFWGDGRVIDALCGTNRYLVRNNRQPINQPTAAKSHRTHKSTNEQSTDLSKKPTSPRSTTQQSTNNQLIWKIDQSKLITPTIIQLTVNQHPEQSKQSTNLINQATIKQPTIDQPKLVQPTVIQLTTNQHPEQSKQSTNRIYQWTINQPIESTNQRSNNQNSFNQQ